MLTGVRTMSLTSQEKRRCPEDTFFFNLGSAILQNLALAFSEDSLHFERK